MPDQIRLWQVGPDEKLKEIQRTRLDLESRLQEWLSKDISILDPGLLVIGREVETDFGGFIDILCIDEDGNLVIVELKRDKTPREITAQTLDYASWTADLSNERITTIANTYLGSTGFDQSFRNCFNVDVPETLNGDHRMLIVGSQIDSSSERIIRYLSDTHGVNINAATFQFYSTPDGLEYLARVFLIEQSEVDLRTRTKGSSKRRPNLSYEELARIASESGVEILYNHAVSLLERHLQKHTTRSSIGFSGLFEDSRKNVLSLIPGQSNAADGLRYQLYKNRFVSLTGITEVDLEALLPESREYWIYYPSAGADYEGFQGYFKTSEEIDRIAGAF
jgi:hypothetical protein